MPLHLGRWRIDRYERALYINKQPDPKCPACEGTGRTDDDALDVERELCDPTPRIEVCDCWNPWGGIRIPLVPRLVITERYPF